MTLARRRRRVVSGVTAQAGHGSGHAGVGPVGQPDGIQRDGHLSSVVVSDHVPSRVDVATDPKPPGPIAEQGDQDDTCPRPIDDVPHVLGQAGRLQIIATSSQGRRSRHISWPTGALQEPLQHQTGQREQDVRRHRRQRETTEEDSDQNEDAMYDDGDEMSSIQDSHVALGELLGRFLSWHGSVSRSIIRSG